MRLRARFEAGFLSAAAGVIPAGYAPFSRSFDGALARWIDRPEEVESAPSDDLLGDVAQIAERHQCIAFA